MNTKVIIGIIVVVVAAGAAYYYFTNSQPAASSPAGDTQTIDTSGINSDSTQVDASLNESDTSDL